MVTVGATMQAADAAALANKRPSPGLIANSITMLPTDDSGLSANGLYRLGKQLDFLRMAAVRPCHHHASSHGDPPMAILSIGSRGPEVVTLQQELNRQLYPSPRLSTDGVFGRHTRDAVRAFQKNAGLKVDGLVGPMTRAALGMPDTGRPFTHRVKLHFRSISLTDVPFGTILAHTQAVYAPYGIRIDFGSGKSLSLTQEEQDRLLQIDGSCELTVTNGEYAELLGADGQTPSDGVAVFYVDRFSEAINGCGGHLVNRPGCIVARAGTSYCTAHEVGHVLLGSTFAPVHIDDTSNNLMHSVDFLRAQPPVLTDLQLQRIKASPLCAAI